MSFTTETEQTIKTSFIDVNILREHGNYTTTVYGAPTFSDVYTRFLKLRFSKVGKKCQCKIDFLETRLDIYTGKMVLVRSPGVNLKKTLWPLLIDEVHLSQGYRATTNR